MTPNDIAYCYIFAALAILIPITLIDLAELL
jgi:hypothetical protein